MVDFHIFIHLYIPQYQRVIKMKKIAFPVLEVSGIVKKNKKVNIDSFNIVVGSGECAAVIHNSSGSVQTLVNILSGGLSADKGKNFFKGDNITGQDNIFGCVGKKPSVSKIKTVTLNGAAPLVKRGLSRTVSSVASKKELHVFGLEACADSRTGSLSAEDFYKAELFAAYMCSHEFIVIDEPFGCLDGELYDKNIEWLKSISEKTNLSMLIFTQKIDTAIKLASTVMVTDDKMRSVGIIGVDSQNPEKTRMRIEQLSQEINLKE